MANDENSGCSGRFVLRIDPGLHGALREAARAAGSSLNEYCVRKLATPLGSFDGWEMTSEAIRRAAQVVGGNLVGVVAFGSWARAELHADSDVDILVVVDEKLQLSRDLYLTWDEAPIQWRGRRVEPHFVHLPDPSRLPLGLWAEIAIDGIVLYARDLLLPLHLVRVRHDIAAGRIIRRLVHGQSYWTEAA
ncbi:MAG: toxin-antitoxin system HicB family antitoxin [Thermoanaerobaculales bacterium]|nr:toxin-antitoxin system HicB family antitoxin [Thermoanaerobaculales bacterium]